MGINEEKVMAFPGDKDDKLPAEETSPLINTRGNGGIDEALDKIGIGFFHVILILVTGWALASDSVEILCIGFVSPQLADSNTNPDLALKPSSVEEGILDGVIFAGMMVGGYFWGSISDIVGRRSCLITSLTVNGIFGFASSLSPHYIAFLFFRFMSGVGVGGSLPVAFSYFCEFFSRKNRGPFVIIVASFWTIGQVFAAVIAMPILDSEYMRSHVNSTLGSITITPWRVYIMLCTFPCLSAALALVFLPESPAFLYSKGKMDKLHATLRRIQRCNSFCCWRRKNQFNGELRPLTPPPMTSSSDEGLSRSQRMIKKMLIIFKSTVDLFRFAYLRPTLVLITVFFTFSFGYYGLLLWFPEYFKCVYQSENNCILSSNEGHRCAPNVTAICNSTGSSLYLDSLYTALATIPATVLGIITVNILGGKLMLALSVFVCGLSAFLIRIVPSTENVTVVLSCVFNGVAIFGWNALDVISTSELFPTHLRSTAIGIQSVLGRVGAILGNVLFGQLIEVDPLIPIAMVAVVLMFGGLVGFGLPSQRGGPSLRKMTSRCCSLVCRQGQRCSNCINRNQLSSEYEHINT
ncbi:synaptic vesicle glycoprotein 2C-like [Halichondria panicea]|uniref:synaptic vesicle glycoprotein 2C-like n=1 Tax=Halichondria panicea TaxID=6063 RepID=UPI00312BB6B2